MRLPMLSWRTSIPAAHAQVLTASCACRIALDAKRRVKRPGCSLKPARISMRSMTMPASAWSMFLTPAIGDVGPGGRKQGYKIGRASCRERGEGLVWEGGVVEKARER